MAIARRLEGVARRSLCFTIRNLNVAGSAHDRRVNKGTIVESIHSLLEFSPLHSIGFDEYRARLARHIDSVHQSALVELARLLNIMRQVSLPCLAAPHQEQVMRAKE